jgi:putative peptidoglycan binding protein
MPKQHTVQEGECVNSIAEQYGFFWQTVWNDPANAKLKQLRQDHGMLVPGDVVVIPDKRVKEETRSSGAVYKFQKLGVPAAIRLQLFDGDQPRLYQAYDLTVDGQKRSGTTDNQGVLQAAIPPNAKQAVVVIGPDRAEFRFQLGSLQPVTEVKGAQARLSNLGYDCAVDGALNDTTKKALVQFQSDYGLPATGSLDTATQKKLADIHDGIGDVAPTASAQSDDRTAGGAH